MQKPIGVYLIGIFLLLTAGQAWATPSETVLLNAFDYPPFYFKKQDQVQGIAVNLINRLCSELDLVPVIRMVPLKRALKNIRTGSADGIMILIKTQERQTYIAYTDPVLSVRGLIWSAADRPGSPVQFNRLEELKAYRIGVTIGYSYGQAFDNLLKTMTPAAAPKDYHNFKKLLHHRIDIFPANELVAKGLFKLYPELKNRFVHSGQSFITWVLHMGISKKSRLAPMIPRINEIIRTMKTQGFIDQTVKTYTE